MNRAEIAFSVLPAIDQCNPMVAYPALGDDLGATLATDAIMLYEYSDPNARRNNTIIILADPFLYASAHFFFQNLERLI